MLDVGDTQLLASLCCHAALQLVEEVRPRAFVRHFPRVRFFVQASKSEGLETRQFGCNGSCDPRCRPPVRIASATIGKHWLCPRIGRLRSTAVGCLRRHSSFGRHWLCPRIGRLRSTAVSAKKCLARLRENIILAHQGQPRCRDQSTRLSSASAVSISSWWRPFVAEGRQQRLATSTSWRVWTSAMCRRLTSAASARRAFVRPTLSIATSWISFVLRSCRRLLPPLGR